MKLNTKIIVYIGLLAAIATVLMFFPHFPVLSAVPFLKVDFADVPALLASVTISPIFGIVIEFIKNLFHLTVSDTAFVGELSNFIVGTIYCLAVGLLSKYTFRNKLMKHKLLFVLPISIIIQTACAAVSNYFIIGPMYFGSDNAQILDFVLAGAIPFNLIKGGVQAVVFYLLYRGISPYIKKNMYLYK
jgi:riboflavin transporter FmnP